MIARSLPDERCVAVAYSGGRDSSALLHAAVRRAREQGLQVWALHVHHGLHPQADAWARHCELTCRRWAARGAPLGFDMRRLQTRPAAGESVEAWARRERYAALQAMALAHGVSLVLLAQHRRDQAETLLLQALRGGGIAGLAAMPRLAQRQGLQWGRPWLELPSEAIDAYVARHRLKHIEDDSNHDPRHARNRLRQVVWPALCDAFPDAEAALSASAAWAGDAQQALAELAQQDLALLCGGDAGDALPLARWLELSPARRSNALRAWLKQRGEQAAPASLVVRLLAELDGHGSARWPAPGGELRRYRGVLRYVADASAPAADGSPCELSIDRAGAWPVAGWRGRLHVERVAEAGVEMALLSRLQAVARQGGEQFQLGPARPARALKKQYQALAVPAWARGGPLLYHGAQLVFVPGLGLDARAWAAPGRPQFGLRWLPDAGG